MKRKGFTLIELLAVIVILAVIALIATPMILGVIETARKGAAESSALGYLDAIELYISTSELKNEEKLIPNQKYNVTTTTVVGDKAYLALNDILDIKGEKSTGSEDYIILSEKYKIKEGKLTLGEYNATIENGEMVVTKGEIIEVEDMTLNFETQTMERGSTTKIEVTFTPKDASNQKVSYKSSNEEIVSVDEEGNIKAIKNGKASITVTSDGNKEVTKEINIEVISPESVEKITLNKEKEEMYVGETNQITAILEPSDATSNALRWESSNDSVAVVSESGLVTGLGVGKVTITATAVSGKTATIEIEIKAILAESITISGNNELIGRAIQLTATVLPENTTDKTITWKSSDEEIATVSSDGLVSGVSDGTVNIIATTSNGKEITKEITVSMPVCIRALDLHTEICEHTSEYCYAAGYTTEGTKGTTTIEYGKLGEQGEALESGDALDCDVDGSGTYDEDERFYYVSDVTDNSNYAALIYYNNTSVDSEGNIQADNTYSSIIAYYSSEDVYGENWHGPITALANLPSENDWNNVKLINTSRTITNEFGETTTYGGGKTIANPFSYTNGEEKYTARLLTTQELETACGLTVDSVFAETGELDACNYLLENTKFSSFSMGAYSYWLETPLANSANNIWTVYSFARYVSSSGTTDTSSCGVRPVIEVPKTDIAN